MSSCCSQQVCQSFLLFGQNVRWPRRMMPFGESRWVCRRDRQPDRRTPDRYITLSARRGQRNNRQKHRRTCFRTLSYFSLSLSLFGFFLQLRSSFLHRLLASLSPSLVLLTASFKHLLAPAAPARKPRRQQARHRVSVLHLQHDRRVRIKPGLAEQSRFVDCVRQVLQNKPGWPSSRHKHQEPSEWNSIFSWLRCSGRTPSDWRTFHVPRSTCSWRVTTYVGKPSAIGQPTRSTQPSSFWGR